MVMLHLHHHPRTSYPYDLHIIYAACMHERGFVCGREEGPLGGRLRWEYDLSYQGKFTYAYHDIVRALEL